MCAGIILVAMGVSMMFEITPNPFLHIYRTIQKGAYGGASKSGCAAFPTYVRLEYIILVGYPLEASTHHI